jgi:hypothetical protein
VNPPTRGSAPWRIEIPYPRRSDALPTVAELARVLPRPDDAAFARQIVIRKDLGGMATVAELLAAGHAGERG